MSEKFSLKWNDYQSNWNKALNELRKDTDFADVTLISDDKVKFSAHRILLSSCSKLFKFILKGNVHGNSLLYLNGVNALNLGFILDYIYYGEVMVYQEQLDSFLESAQKLEIEGLLGGNEGNHDNLNEGHNLHQQPEENIEHKNYVSYAQLDEKSLAKTGNEVDKTRRPYSRATKYEAKIDVGSLTSEEIDNKMRELYERTDEGWKCWVCEHKIKGQRSSDIRRHVECHMDGLVFACNLCHKEFNARTSLSTHKSSFHRSLTIKGCVRL